MNFNQLKYFIELAKIKSFSKAAKNLKISQPALSFQIKKLEEEYGIKLFNRSQTPIELTNEGSLFFEKSLQIIHLTEDLDNWGHELEDSPSGELKMGIIPTLSPYLVPLFIEHIHHKFPDLRIEIQELTTKELVNQLYFGEIDLALLSTPINSSHLTTQALFYEKFFLYLSDKHPLATQQKFSPNQLPADQLWFLKEGNCFQNQMNSLCSIPDFNETNFPFRYISNSIESLKRMVEQVGGMTLIPELATMNIPESYEDFIRTFKDPVPVREISVAYSREKGLRNGIQQVIDEIKNCIPANMKKKPQHLIDPNLSFT